MERASLPPCDPVQKLGHRDPPISIFDYRCCLINDQVSVSRSLIKNICSRLTGLHALSTVEESGVSVDGKMLSCSTAERLFLSEEHMGRNPITKVLRALSWLIEEPSGSTGVREMATALGLSPSSAHRLLTAL